MFIMVARSKSRADEILFVIVQSLKELPSVDLLKGHALSAMLGQKITWDGAPGARTDFHKGK